MKIGLTLLAFAALYWSEGVCFSCTDPKEVGTCKASFQRFYYNSQTAQCEEFTYGGCGGNDNNYETLDACITTCRPDHRCQKPKDAGNCFADIKRYFFDSSSYKCKEFTYGGCLGNSNNFETEEACLNECSPCDGKLCYHPNQLCLVDYNNQPKCECPIFDCYYLPEAKICGTDGKTYRNTCEMEDISCRGNFAVFKLHDGECNPCDGKQCYHPNQQCLADGNNQPNCGCPIFDCYFLPEAKICGSDGKTYRNTCEMEDISCRGNFIVFELHPGECKPSRCYQPQDVGGPCLAAIPSYSFDYHSNTCVEFTYSGCGGNDNNFATQQDCISACQ